MKQLLYKRIHSVLTEMNDQPLLKTTDLAIEDLPLHDRLLRAYLTKIRAELEVLHVENADAKPQDEPDTGQHDDDEFLSRLKALLKSNWDLVKCTPLSYTAIPDHFLTRFFCDIATQLACPEGLELKTIGHQLIAQAQHHKAVLTNVTEVADQRVYPIHLLMPGVQVVNIKNGTLDVVGLTLHDAIHTHVESERAEYLIPILSLLDVGIDDNLEKMPNAYYHETHHSETQCFISSAEIARLSTHSAETSAICNAKHAYDELLKRDNCLLARLKELIKLLRYNSSHGGIGTNELAAEGAFTALTNFFEAYESLLPAIRRLSDEDYWALNDLWHAIHKLGQYAYAEIEYQKTQQGSYVIDEQGSRVPVMDAIIKNGETVMVPKCHLTNLEPGSCIGQRKDDLLNAMHNRSDLLLRIKPSADERTQQLEKLKSNFVSAQDGLRVAIIQARYQGYAIHGMSKKVLDAFKVPFALSANNDLAYHQLKVLSDDELSELCQSDQVKRCIASSIWGDEAFHQLMLAVSPAKVQVLLPILLTRTYPASATLIMALDLIDFEKSIIFFKQLVNFRPDIVFNLNFLCGLCSNSNQKKFSFFLEIYQARISELFCTSVQPLDFLDEGSPVYFENLTKLSVLLITHSNCQWGSNCLLEIFENLTTKRVVFLVDRLKGLWHNIKWVDCAPAAIIAFFSALKSEQVLTILREVDGESLNSILSCAPILLMYLSTEQLLSLYKVLNSWRKTLLDPSKASKSVCGAIEILFERLPHDQMSEILVELDDQLLNICAYNHRIFRLMSRDQLTTLCTAFKGRWHAIMLSNSMASLNALFLQLSEHHDIAEIITELEGHFNELIKSKDDFTFLSEYIPRNNFFELCMVVSGTTHYMWHPRTIVRTLEALTCEQKITFCGSLVGRWSSILKSCKLFDLEWVFLKLVGLPFQKQVIVDELSSNFQQYIQDPCDISFACRYFIAEDKVLAFFLERKKLFLADFYHALDCIPEILSVMPLKDRPAFLRQFSGYWVQLLRERYSLSTLVVCAGYSDYVSVANLDFFQYLPEELVRSFLSEIKDGLAQYQLPFSFLVKLLPSLLVDDAEWLLTSLFDYLVKSMIDFQQMIKLIKVMPTRFITVFCNAMGEKFLALVRFQTWHCDDWKENVDRYKYFILAVMASDTTYIPNPSELKLIFDTLSSEELDTLCEWLGVRSQHKDIESRVLLNMFAVLTPEQITSIGPRLQGLFSRHIGDVKTLHKFTLVLSVRQFRAFCIANKAPIQSALSTTVNYQYFCDQVKRFESALTSMTVRRVEPLEQYLELVRELFLYDFSLRIKSNADLHCLLAQTPKEHLLLFFQAFISNQHFSAELWKNESLFSMLCDVSFEMKLKACRVAKDKLRNIIITIDRLAKLFSNHALPVKQSLYNECRDSIYTLVIGLSSFEMLRKILYPQAISDIYKTRKAYLLRTLTDSHNFCFLYDALMRSDQADLFASTIAQKVSLICNDYYDFALILQRLTPEKIKELGIHMAVRLPDLIRSKFELRYIVRQLSAEQIAALCVILREHLYKLVQCREDADMLLSGLRLSQMRVLFVVVFTPILAKKIKLNEFVDIFSDASDDEIQAACSVANMHLFALACKISSNIDVTVERKVQLAKAIRTLLIAQLTAYQSDKQGHTIALLNNYTKADAAHWLISCLRYNQSNAAQQIKQRLDDPINSSTLFKKLLPGVSKLKDYYLCGYVAATLLSSQ